MERLVGERVNDAQQRQAITEKIVDGSVQLVDERGKTRLTTHEVLEVERTLATAADGLAPQRRDVAIVRQPDQRLDEQQQRAYTYATDADERLKVITAVPGAGKTRLISEMGAAYAEAGYNVRAVSVANSAVDVLQRETDAVQSSSRPPSCCASFKSTTRFRCATAERACERAFRARWLRPRMSRCSATQFRR